jgi:hypothetical protein
MVNFRLDMVKRVICSGRNGRINDKTVIILLFWVGFDRKKEGIKDTELYSFLFFFRNSRFLLDNIWFYEQKMKFLHS